MSYERTYGADPKNFGSQIEQDNYNLELEVKELKERVSYLKHWDEQLDLQYKKDIKELESKLAKVQACNEYHHEEMSKAHIQLSEATEVIKMQLAPVFDDNCEGCREADKIAREFLSKHELNIVEN